MPEDRDRPLSDAERRLWRKVTDALAPEAPPEVEDFARLLDGEPEKTLPAAPDSGKPPPGQRLRADAAGAGGTDRRTDEKLRRGRLRIEARLDLHGMTQDEARAALFSFIDRCRAQDRRVVLVITGKGTRSAEEGGVLRRCLPGWLQSAGLAEKVLSFHSARPRHGGAGAFYVLLRRRR